MYEVISGKKTSIEIEGNVWTCVASVWVGVQHFI